MASVERFIERNQGAMNKEQEKIFQHAANVQSAIEDMLTNEESDFYVNLNEIEDGNITPFITGMCIAHLSVLQKLCHIKGNFLDGIHMENRLIVQYLMNYGKVDK